MMMERKRAAEVLAVASGLVLIAAAMRATLGTVASMAFGAGLVLLFTKDKPRK